MATILIVDDSVSIRAFLETQLTQVGHKVTSASDGAMALECLRRQPFDLVITDIYMPDVDGIETICRAREANLLPRLIAISSKDSGVNLMPTARALGAMQTLHKPFTAKQLIEAVDTVLKLPVFGPGTGKKCRHPRVHARDSKTGVSHRNLQ